MDLILKDNLTHTAEKNKAPNNEKNISFFKNKCWFKPKQDPQQGQSSVKENGEQKNEINGPLFKNKCWYKKNNCTTSIRTDIADPHQLGCNEPDGLKLNTKFSPEQKNPTRVSGAPYVIDARPSKREYQHNTWRRHVKKVDDRVRYYDATLCENPEPRENIISEMKIFL